VNAHKPTVARVSRRVPSRYANWSRSHLEDNGADTERITTPQASLPCETVTDRRTDGLLRYLIRLCATESKGKVELTT